MNTEITTVNIICPHCEKDSYRSQVVDVKSASGIGIISADNRHCGNCGKTFKVTTTATITTEKL